MKYKYILFDMDGTVLDTVEDLKNAMNHVLREYGLKEITTAQTCSYLGNGAKNYVKCAVDGKLSPEKEEELYRFYREYYNAHCREATAPYPGIMDMLDALMEKGCKAAIVSNKPDAAVKELAEEFFKGKIETAIGETAEVRRKPAPDMVLKTMEAMGCGDRGECVYIGDTEVDVQTAANAGMDCITVSWGFRTKQQLKEAGATAIVDSAEELTEALCCVNEQ